MFTSRSHLRVSSQSVLLRPDLVEALPLHLVLLLQALSLFTGNLPLLLFDKVLQPFNYEVNVDVSGEKSPRRSSVRK